jgi:hypothetical protein
MVQVASLAKTKGQTFRTLMKCIRDLRGDLVADEILGIIPRGVSDALRLGGIVAGGWYPIEWYTDIHHAVSQVTGEGLPFARELGRATTRQIFSGPYRFITYVLSPRSIISLGQRAFSTFFDTGTVHILEAKDSLVRVEFLGCDGFDPWLWEDLIGSNEMLVGLGGGKNCQVQILAGGGNLPNLKLEYRWE